MSRAAASADMPAEAAARAFADGALAAENVKASARIESVLLHCKLTAPERLQSTPTPEARIEKDARAGDCAASARRAADNAAACATAAEKDSPATRKGRAATAPGSRGTRGRAARAAPSGKAGHAGCQCAEGIGIGVGVGVGPGAVPLVPDGGDGEGEAPSTIVKGTSEETRLALSSLQPPLSRRRA